MTPTRPYFLRAVYEWIVDNDCTPFLSVNADYPQVEVPTEYVEDGQIILNAAPSAIVDLQMDNNFVQFSAKFNGVARNISVPVATIIGIYAKENGQGMVFPDESEYSVEGADLDLDPDPQPPAPPSGSKRKSAKVSHLKVVK